MNTLKYSRVEQEMKRVLLNLLVILLLTTIYVHAASVSDRELSVNTDESSKFKISSLLLAEITRNESNEKIPVIIHVIDPSINNLNLNPQQRALAINSLKNHSTISQHNIIAELQKKVDESKANNIRRLWTINAIAVELSPDDIFDISRLPEVQRIQCDHKINIEDPDKPIYDFITSSLNNNSDKSIIPSQEPKIIPKDIRRTKRDRNLL